MRLDSFARKPGTLQTLKPSSNKYTPHMSGPSRRLALQRLYHWEATAPHKVCFTQPMGQGVVQTFTWSEAADEARRMANHLQHAGDFCGVARDVYRRYATGPSHIFLFCASVMAQVSRRRSHQGATKKLEMLLKTPVLNRVVQKKGRGGMQTRPQNMSASRAWC